MSRLWTAFLASDPAFRILLVLQCLALASWAAAPRLGERWARSGRWLGGAAIGMNLLLLVRLGIAADQLPVATPAQILLAFAFLVGLAAWIESLRSDHLGLPAQVFLLGLLLAALGRADLEVPDLPPGLRGPGPLSALLLKLGAWAVLSVPSLLALSGLVRRAPDPVEHALPWLRAAFALLALGALLEAGAAPGGATSCWTPATLLGCAVLLHLRRVPAWRKRAFAPALLLLWGFALAAVLGPLPPAP